MTLHIPFERYNIATQVLAHVDAANPVATPKGFKYPYTCPGCHKTKPMAASTLTYKRDELCTICSHSWGKRRTWVEVHCRECGILMRKVSPTYAAAHKGTKRCQDCLAKAKAYKAANRRPIRKGVGYLQSKGYRIYPLCNMSDADKALMPGTKRVLEHRLVMARYIGRPLKREELVRHLNGNKTDNRIENLALGDDQDNKNDHMTDFKNMLAWRQTAVTLMWILANAR